MKTVQMYIEEQLALQEVNRIIQGISRETGKPGDHIGGVWKETEKELVLKHKFGVTDRYKEIGKIVRGKMGLDPKDVVPTKELPPDDAEVDEEN